MRGLVATAITALVVGAAVRFGAELGEQLRDPTSTLRLRAGELSDRLREVTP